MTPNDSIQNMWCETRNFKIDTITTTTKQKRNCDVYYVPDIAVSYL